MPHGVSLPSSKRRHPFIWVVAALVPVCAVVYVGAAIAIWQYGSSVQSFGWTAAATRRGVLVASVEPGGAADGHLRPGDVIVGASTGVIPPVGFLRRAAPAGRSYTIRLASPQSVSVELAAPLIRAGPLGRLLAIFVSAVAYAGVGLFLGLARPDLPAGRIICLSFVCTGFVQLFGLDSFSDQLPRAGRLVNGALSLFPGICKCASFSRGCPFPRPGAAAPDLASAWDRRVRVGCGDPRRLGNFQRQPLVE
jgi:hypothetical protein